MASSAMAHALPMVAPCVTSPTKSALGIGVEDEGVAAGHAYHHCSLNAQTLKAGLAEQNSTTFRLKTGGKKMRRLTKLSIVASLILASQPATAERFSYWEKEELLAAMRQRTGPIRVPFKISYADPRVSAIESEGSHIKVTLDEQKFRAEATLRVMLREPVEASDIDEIGNALREAASQFDVVGVRFFLEGIDLEARDPKAGTPLYAWRLYWDGRETVSTMYGVSPAEVASQFAKFTLRDGEKITALWVDHTLLNGVVAMTEKNGEPFLIFLLDPQTRYRMRLVKSSSEKRYEAVESVGPLGTFAADGNGTDRVAALVRKDGAIWVFGGRNELPDKAWLIGRRTAKTVGRQ